MSYPLPTLDGPAFRRRLADLEDVEASGVFSPESFREAASDFVCALAIAFNRRELDAKTLWSRIGSAIETAVPLAQGGDLMRFEHHALAHVMARVSIVAASDDYIRLTSEMRQYDEEAAVHFVRYLSEHLYPTVIFGRQKWEQHKEVLDKERKRLEKLTSDEPVEGAET